MYWRKSFPKIRNYVFADINDVRQVAWLGILERKVTRQMIEDGINGNEGLLATIVSRSIIDYVRHIVGRANKDNSGEYLNNKKSVWKSEFHFMEYNDYNSDFIPFELPSKDAPVDAQVAENILKQEIEDFISSKLNKGERMIYQYIKSGKMSARDAGKKFKLTESRISQVKSNAENKIKKHFNKKDWK